MAEMVHAPATRNFGMIAEFQGPDELLESARQAYAAGYRQLEAYTPFPVEGLAEVIGFRRTWVPLIVLIGGIVGGLSGYALEYYVAVIAYPINVGGRPYNSIPMFVPVVFEMTILFAALAAVVSMIALNGLPMPYHPVFNVPEFVRATTDRFFLVIRSTDPNFDADRTRQFLRSLGAEEVADVPE